METSWQILKQTFGDAFQLEVPMSKQTSVGLGGPAKAFLTITTQAQLQQALAIVKDNQIDFLIIGGGSNLLVADEGIPKLVIKNNITGIEAKEDQIKVEAGTALQELVDYTITNGLTGIHKMTGIPGTVGGAVFGNAGAYGQMTGDHLVFVTAMNPQTLEISDLSKQACQFSYRDSGFKTNGLIILNATFKFDKADSKELADESAECLTLRQAKYVPGIKCPGSFFRNFLAEEIPAETIKLLPPRKDTYGKIPAYVFLEQLGFKGRHKGDILITDFHANLFINQGNGTTKDFYDLAKEAFLAVKEKYGIELEPEVQLVNLPPLNS